MTVMTELKVDHTKQGAEVAIGILHALGQHRVPSGDRGTDPYLVILWPPPEHRRGQDLGAEVGRQCFHLDRLSKLMDRVLSEVQEVVEEMTGNTIHAAAHIPENGLYHPTQASPLHRLMYSEATNAKEPGRRMIRTSFHKEVTAGVE